MAAERTRTLRVDYLSRVEGEGALTVKLKGGVATQVQLAIFEPPRFFEALLRGRSCLEAPDITARICGICPVAYLMSACLAVEDALGLTLPEPLRRARRLLYCGEWIESHALHVFLLHCPDFLGFPDAVSLARVHRGWVQAGLQIKKVGNALVSALGGREIHPINVKVGGFYSLPPREALRELLPGLRQATEAAVEALAWISTFSFPEAERRWELVCVEDGGDYPIFGRALVSSAGLHVPVSSYDAHFEERQAPWSNALRSVRVGGGAYLCGPLARFNLAFDRLRPQVQALARRHLPGEGCWNPFRSIQVRMLEIVQALLEAQALIEEFPFKEEPCVPLPAMKAGIGYGATEAPRGLLYHRYTLAEDGALLDAQIVAPTAQNQLSIEADIGEAAPQLAALPRDEATRLAERLVRNHDPCISCATHFLTLNLEVEA